MTQIRVSDLAWKRLANDKESALHQVLRRAIPEKLPLLSKDAIVDLKVGIYGYIMHVNSYVELKRLIKYWDLDSGDANRILHAILESYEANLGLKQVTLICMEKKRLGKKCNYEKLLAKCQMHPGNAVILNCIDEINFKRNLLTGIKERPILLPYEVQNNCQELMSGKLKSYISSFVYRKLTFIVKHNKFEHQDLESDLVRKGVETYYRVTPLLTDLHRENSVKQSIHNQGMKIISFYTSKKRARLSDGDHQPTIDSIFNAEGGIDDTKMGDLNWQLPFTEIDACSVLRNFSQPNTKRNSVIEKLLCSSEDEHFDLFVRKRLRLSENDTLEQVYRNKTTGYVNLIAEYHEIPVLTVRGIALELLQAFNGKSLPSTNPDKGITKCR